ncbi:PG0541 family transporter-associated protein [Entomospira culicis]|uniref:Uncharacterized protein n=1 Tax=Entomospira culicis TaxID=2719989 RepID=A0A968KVJ5_9SPIO|nr:PG0541 family transporter-associated protein [Entomospira culicis]NIZ18973.1 hypothetical protein [Entomospira culicis]NIZ69188.1 hypothetical protein [Entomospira culicis]WDI37774.1 hypothetical protein PVA46_03035 [Entomospira culicis]WDI39402.1 hypothetical protein PVA47_03040 [Entomospira culicis]
MSKPFYRIEIIINQSLRDELLQEFQTIECQYFTEIPLAYGQGRQEPKQGDGIWPETNGIFIIYGDEKTLKDLRTSIDLIKERFPHEGIKMFALKSQG